MTDPSILAEMARMRTEHDNRVEAAAQLKASLILRHPLLHWDVTADSTYEMIVSVYVRVNGVELTVKMSVAYELPEPERYIAYMLSKNLANIMLDWQPKHVEWRTP